METYILRETPYFYDMENRVGADIASIKDHLERHPEIGARSTEEYFSKAVEIINTGKPHKNGFRKGNMFVAVTPVAVQDPIDGRVSLRVIRTLHKRRDLKGLIH
ncbi:MAG: hypothetical protein Q8Q42_02555 [Nanoarchaeota archaeon]|nr:hypothetical protein [Nanoarchaeota archaeon]